MPCTAVFSLLWSCTQKTWFYSHWYRGTFRYNSYVLSLSIICRSVVRISLISKCKAVSKTAGKRTCCSRTGGGWMHWCPPFFPVPAPERCQGRTRGFKALGPWGFPFFPRGGAGSVEWAMGVSVCGRRVAVTWVPQLQGICLEELVLPSSPVLQRRGAPRPGCSHQAWGVGIMYGVGTPGKMFARGCSWPLPKQWMSCLLQTSDETVTPA